MACHSSRLRNGPQHFRRLALCLNVPRPRKNPLFSKDIGAPWTTKMGTQIVGKFRLVAPIFDRSVTVGSGGASGHTWRS